jgi:hypothetical protein
LYPISQNESAADIDVPDQDGCRTGGLVSAVESFVDALQDWNSANAGSAIRSVLRHHLTDAPTCHYTQPRQTIHLNNLRITSSRL